MATPKCPKCQSGEYVTKVKTFTKAGAVAGAVGGAACATGGGVGGAAGSAADNMLGKCECNKCHTEFEVNE